MRAHHLQKKKKKKAIAGKIRVDRGFLRSRSRPAAHVRCPWWRRGSIKRWDKYQEREKGNGDDGGGS